MWSLIERAKRVIFALALSTIPLVLLYAQSKDTQLRSVLAWPVLQVIGGIERAALSMTGSVSDVLYRYFFVVDRSDELLSLRAEVLETRALKVKIADLVQEQASILDLYFNSPSSEVYRREFARVVARAGAPMARMIRLDKGSLSGVKPRSPVLSHEGVVGQIMTVAPNFSDVLLITDASSAIEAKMVGSGARGLLRGITSSTEYLMEIRDIDGLAQVQVGDVVVTSGLNSFFPSGIPIGKIIDASSSRDGLYVSARIKPFVIMDQVDNVIVLLEQDGLAGQNHSFSAAWPLATK